MKGTGFTLEDRNGWLIPFMLAVAILVPAGGVLWFMNEAAQSQAQAVRQSVNEAFRGQLRLLRDRLDAAWQTRAAALEQAAGSGLPANFPAALTASGADAVLFLDDAGQVRYPEPPAALSPDPLSGRREWLAASALEQRGDRMAAAAAYARLADTEASPSFAARAARAAIRCLARAGDNAAALAAISKYFASGRAAKGVDLDGRLIAADEQLFALHLMKRADQRFQPAAQHLAEVLNSYEGAPIPSAQRLFLIGELRSLAPDLRMFPFFAAEQLALTFLDSEKPRPGGTGLQPGGVPDLWKLTSPNRRAFALYRTATVVSMMGHMLSEQNTSRAVEFGVAPPGATIRGEGIPAGAMAPGWQISVSLLDSSAVEQAVRQRRNTYIGIGLFVIGVIVLVALMLGQAFRRQARLARMKSDLVATVSHELKTPLASICLLVETLLEENSVPPEKAREYLEMIAGENQRLTRLIENFLTFSRMERKRQRFEFCDTRPAEVVESALRSLSERLESPGCHLEVDVTPGLPVLHADRDALVTVLLNLLDNACKYTHEEKRLVVRAYRSDGSVVFAVQDNGIGIAPRDQRRIFQRFYQVDQRLARETGGCGLGLSIVDVIVRAHGGEIKVQSTVGSGSTFSVFLPCHAAKEAVG